MKKLWAFIFIIFIISLVMLSPNEGEIFLADSIVEYYLPNPINLDIGGVNILPNGEGCIIEANSNLSSIIEEKIDNYSGKTYKKAGNYQNFIDIVEDYDILIDSSQSSQDNILGYSAKIDKRTIVAGKTINIQVLFKDNIIYVGIPLLLGSY